MIKLSDLRSKEVINIYNGQRMGYISDFEIDLEKGALLGIIIFEDGKIMSLFSKPNDIYIEWKRIIKIGEDAILVNIKAE